MSSKEKELENLYTQLYDLEDEIRYIKSCIEELEDELEGEICTGCNGSGEGNMTEQHVGTAKVKELSDDYFVY